MDEKKKFILTIVASLVGLFFLFTRFYLPLARDNAKHAAEYKQLKQEVKTIGEFSKEELDFLQGQVDTAIADLEGRFPPEGKLKLMEQLTQVPVDSNIVFKEITHREQWEMEGCQVFPVDVSMKAPFHDLIKYLAGIEASPLMISVSSLSIRKVEPEPKPLDIRVTFLSFRLIPKFPPMSEYMEERFGPFDKGHLERLLEPVKLADSESAVLRLKDYNPFVYGFGRPGVEEIAYPGLEALSLKGILRIGDKKVALINDIVVREGEKIAGCKVEEIGDYRVVLMRAGKRYILKLGE